MGRQCDINKLISDFGFTEPVIIDGIIDDDKYRLCQKNKKGILFIAKEVNAKKGESWDFTEWWNEEIKYVFSHRIATWAYGLVCGFPPYEEALKHKTQAIKSIAFININKKSGGGGAADRDRIIKAGLENKKLINAQINIIEPDIIIGCGMYKRIWDDVLEVKNWIPSGYDIKIARWGKIRVVDYYHPSNRYPGAMNYALLEKVINSKRFKEL